MYIISGCFAPLQSGETRSARYDKNFAKAIKVGAVLPFLTPMIEWTKKVIKARSVCYIQDESSPPIHTKPVLIERPILAPPYLEQLSYIGTFMITMLLPLTCFWVISNEFLVAPAPHTPFFLIGRSLFMCSCHLFTFIVFFRFGTQHCLNLDIFPKHRKFESARFSIQSMTPQTLRARLRRDSAATFSKERPDAN